MGWGKCSRCGIETSSIETHKCEEITCVYCGYEGPKVYKKELEGFHFGYTEPDYGDGWECPKCKFTVTGRGFKIPLPQGYGLYSPLKKVACPKCGHKFDA